MTPRLDEYPKLLLLLQRLSVGTQLFFVLSGYLVAASFDRCISNGEGVGGFLLRRAAKLLPLYFIFLHLNIGLFFISQELAPDLQLFRNSPSTENLSWNNYIVHLLLLQGFVPAWLNTLLDGSWSIVNEAYFYIIFAALPMVMLRTSLAIAKMYAVSLGLAILFVLLIGRYYEGYSHYGFFSQLPCFILGIFVRRIKAKPGFEESFAPWGVPVFIVAMLLMAGWVKGESKPLDESHVYALCFAALLLFSSALVRHAPGLLNKVLASFGRQSYALFLVHLVFLKIWWALVEVYGLQMNFSTALLTNILIAVPLTWLVSKTLVDPIDRYFVHRADDWLKQQQFQHLSR